MEGNKLTNTVFYTLSFIGAAVSTQSFYHAISTPLVNASLEVMHTIHAVAQEQHLSEHEAALRLADQLADVPELAVLFVSW